MCDQCEDISWQLGREEREAEIIALLEAEMDNVSELPGALGETLSDHIFELIALIKGENK